MTFVPFTMERWQSIYEHAVDLNISESGVHPLTLAELVDLAGIDRAELDGCLLEYVQSNGGEVIFMEPNYFQIRGIAENLGVPGKSWWLERPSRPGSLT